MCQRLAACESDGQDSHLRRILKQFEPPGGRERSLLRLPLFVVVADQSVKTREVLQLNNCKLENGTLWASAPLAFEEWVCDAPNYEAFRVVLTTCSGRYSEWAANGCCAYDRSVQVDNLTSPIMLQMAFNLPSIQTYILGPHMRCKHHQP